MNLIVDVPDETVPETDNSESTELSPEELAAQEAEQARAKYKELFEKNDDFIGWIAIDGTNVNYPVMQTPDNGFRYFRGYNADMMIFYESAFADSFILLSLIRSVFASSIIS